MISWLRNKIQRYRKWRTNHEESWVGFDHATSDGVTRFQVEMLEALKKEPGVVDFELVKGEKENYYKGTLVGSGHEFFLYFDEAQLAKAIYERWAFDSRQHLTEEFLKNAAKRI